MEVIMNTIMPITELRNTNKIAKICEETKEPVYLTKNGYGKLVIMDADVFETFSYKKYMHDEIMKGLDDINNGRFEDGEKAMKDIADEFGL